jgi:hypothetical protein
MDPTIRTLVRNRAEGRCEYCRLPQNAAPYYSFHVEHIVARQHQGSDDETNLALACPDCNAKKGPNIATLSPDTGHVIELFHPRRHIWSDHFSLVGSKIVGISEIGRATAQLLDMNEDERVAIREQLLEEGVF